MILDTGITVIYGVVLDGVEKKKEKNKTGRKKNAGEYFEIELWCVFMVHKEVWHSS